MVMILVAYAEDDMYLHGFIMKDAKRVVIYRFTFYCGLRSARTIRAARTT